MEDYIDPRIAIPLALALWVIVMFPYAWIMVKPRLVNYFAKRRHIRRLHNIQKVNYIDSRRHS